MKKISNLKRQTEGITLIALVITIIVLLILAAISIATLTGQNGILTRAQTAKTTNDKVEAEETMKLITSEWQMAKTANNNATLGGYLESKVTSGELDKVTDNKDGSYTMELNGYKGTISDKSGLGKVEKTEDENLEPAEIKVGDYVNYTPDKADDYQLTYDLCGERGTQNIVQDDLKWRILNINSDGSYDLISSVPTSVVKFDGEIGYNNGVTLMNDICEKQYSNKTLKVNARNLKIEDIEDLMTGDWESKRYYNGDVNFGEVGTVASNWWSSCPKLYDQEIGSGVNVDETAGVKTTGIGRSENTAIIPKADSSIDQTGDKVLKATETFYSLDNIQSYLDKDKYELLCCSGSSFLASRCVDLYNSGAFFNLSCIGETGFGAKTMCMASLVGGGILADFGLRPIVHLENVTLNPCLGENKENNMHTIEA